MNNIQNEELENGTVANEEAAVVKAKPAKKAAKKKPAKKVAKKAAPKKVKKLVAKVKEEVKPLTAGSIKEAISTIKKSGLKRGMISVGGKKYSFSVRNSWAINRNLIEAAEHGFIMIIEEEGYYVYPKTAFKEYFGAIMDSGTYEKTGTYSQSVLPQWHSDFFTPVK